MSTQPTNTPSPIVSLGQFLTAARTNKWFTGRKLTRYQIEQTMTGIEINEGIQSMDEWKADMQLFVDGQDSM